MATITELNYRIILRNHMTELHDRSILRNRIMETHYDRYITADILRQIYYDINIYMCIYIYCGVYITADILRQACHGNYITAYI